MQRIILIPDRIKENIDIEKEIFGKGYEIITQDKKVAEDIPLEIWQSASAILAWHEINYDAELISKLINCKVIVRVGVGYDNVDLEFANKKGIIICNVPDYGTNDVADHTMALLLSLSRCTNAYDDIIRKNKTWEWDIKVDIKRINNLTIGIIGLGRIGTAVAIRARVFGLNVLFYDPYLPQGIDKVFGYKRYDNLYEMINICDYISFHSPLTSETNNLANDEFFSNIKQDSIIINTARGKIVSLDSLYNALKENILKAAGLDVLENEPPDFGHPLISAWENNELWIKNRLIITPHAAFYNKESYIEMRSKAAMEAKRVLEGKKPKNCVNFITDKKTH